MERGIIIDAHTHPIGPRMDKGTVKNYAEQTIEFGTKVELGVLAKTLEQMDKYHVDKAIGLTAIGLIDAPDMNQQMIQIVQEHSDRFPGVMIAFRVPQHLSGQNRFKGADAAEEIEPLLDLPEVKGVGEWAYHAAGGMMEWPELWREYRPIMDVIAEHKSAVLFHTGVGAYPSTSPRSTTRGSEGRASRRKLYFSNPMFVADIAQEYPEVPIIIGHMGVQGFFYFGTYADMALLVAATNPNVYLETSSAPFEVVEKAVCDPAIGPEKIIFGTDTPAPYSYYKYRDEYYPSYGKAPPIFYTDHYKYDLGNIERLSIPDREKELILGGNIARILRL